MAFPNIFFGPEQEPFNAYATTDRQGHYAGQLLNTGDGRWFRWAKNGATLLVAGDVLQASAPITNHVGQTPTSAGAVGDTTVTLTIGATAITADQYRDGTMLIEDGTGFGYAYPLDTHIAYSASATTVAIPFKRGVTLQVAVPTTANTVTLVSNSYVGVIQAPTTATAQIVGVAVKPLAANAWGWIQVRGPAAVTTSGTLVIGNPAGVGGAAGAVLPIPTTFTANWTTQRVGQVMRVAATTKKSLIFLDGFP